jgi:hypothetical protein
VKIAVKIGDGIEEASPDSPRSFVWLFLMYFLKIRLALAPEVVAITDTRSKAIPSSIEHVGECKYL